MNTRSSVRTAYLHIICRSLLPREVAKLQPFLKTAAATRREMKEAANESVLATQRFFVVVDEVITTFTPRCEYRGGGNKTVDTARRALVDCWKAATIADERWDEVINGVDKLIIHGEFYMKTLKDQRAALSTKAELIESAAHAVSTAAKQCESANNHLVETLKSLMSASQPRSRSRSGSPLRSRSRSGSPLRSRSESGEAAEGLPGAAANGSPPARSFDCHEEEGYVDNDK